LCGEGKRELPGIQTAGFLWRLLQVLCLGESDRVKFGSQDDEYGCVGVEWGWGAGRSGCGF
jgi:hypothetical protein